MTRGARLDRAGVATIAVGVLAVASAAQFLPGAIRAYDSWALYAQTDVFGSGSIWSTLADPVRDGPAAAPIPYWRPVSLLTYAGEQLLGGPVAPIAHGINILLHACVAVLTTRLVLRFVRSIPLAVLAGGLVATAPVLVESVPAAARRHDVLAALFGLLALHRAMSVPDRRNSIEVAALCVAAAASKEAGLVVAVPVAVLTVGKFGTTRQSTVRLLAVAGGLGTFLLLRLLVIAQAGPPPRSGASLDIWSAFDGTLDAVVIPGPVATWALAVAAVAVTALVSILTRRHERGTARAGLLLAAVGTSWGLSLVVLTGTAGRGTGSLWRTLYQVVPPFALLLTGLLSGALAIGSDRLRHLVTAAAAVLIVPAVTGTLTATPLAHRYDEWATVSEVSARHTSAVDRAARAGAERLAIERTVVRVRPTGELHVRSATVVGTLTLRGYAAVRGYELEVADPEPSAAEGCQVRTSRGVRVVLAAGPDGLDLRARGEGCP